MELFWKPVGTVWNLLERNCNLLEPVGKVTWCLYWNLLEPVETCWNVSIETCWNLLERLHGVVIGTIWNLLEPINWNLLEHLLETVGTGRKVQMGTCWNLMERLHCVTFGTCWNLLERPLEPVVTCWKGYMVSLLQSWFLVLN